MNAGKMRTAASAICVRISLTLQVLEAYRKGVADLFWLDQPDFSLKEKSRLALDYFRGARNTHHFFYRGLSSVGRASQRY